MPSGIARSQTSKVLLQPASVHPFDDHREGLARLCSALADEERAYGTIYFGDADALMHMTGPDAPEVAALMEEHLSAFAEAPWPEGTLVLLTADHGMEGISPERSTYVNVVWPELGEHLVSQTGLLEDPHDVGVEVDGPRHREHLERPVEHCPGWNVADLVWHLTEVHWFWSTIAADTSSTSAVDTTCVNTRSPRRMPSTRQSANSVSRSLALENRLVATVSATAATISTSNGTKIFQARSRMSSTHL